MIGRIEQRVKEEALYIIQNNATVRQAAEHFGMGKSTIHYDMTYRLTKLDPFLSVGVRKVLDYNLFERAARGGQQAAENKRRKL